VPRGSSRERLDGIMARREELLADIARLRARGETSRFVENAQRLLTLWWSRASWSGREQILRSAGWLTRLAKVGHD
jgi:hypothetical protein